MRFRQHAAHFIINHVGRALAVADGRLPLHERAAVRVVVAESREAHESGLSVIVDATFLKYRHRERFIRLATELTLPAFILDSETPDAVFQACVEARSRACDDVSDADTSVLFMQRLHADPLTGDERRITETIRTDVDPDSFGQRRYWPALLLGLVSLCAQSA
ncbi:AAA family ATPase [Caballeronia grimmiae]|uniref:AAA family ATPase n=1 Tax=Caballeronia grimmiae TaxID=1071679 RepID=UPI0038B93C85